MGRKIDMKKIEDVTKCQVTFSKRRSSLMKKANEVAVCCDVDVAFVAFSPSGRVSKFSNQNRIEDVLHRFVNLPADKRLHHINNVQGKMEKLKQLSHINGETSKLHFLDKQIENLELQIKKRGLELQILETGLRDYEIGAEQEPSLHQLSWCERNLNHSLQRVIAKKMELVNLERQSQQPNQTCINQNEQVNSMIENPIAGQILMQLDPWISPYSAKVRESIFQDLVDPTKQSMNDNMHTLNQPMPSNVSNSTIQESLQPYIASEQCVVIDQPAAYNFQDQNNVNNALKQSLMMDQTLFKFQEQNNVSAHNNASSVLYSDAVQMSTRSFYTIQDPSGSTPTLNTRATNPSTSGMTQSFYDEMGSILQGIINSDLMSQFSNMEGSQEFGGNVNMGENSIFLNGNNNRIDNNIHEDVGAINIDQMHNNEDFHTQNASIDDQIHINQDTEDFRAINADQTPINYQQEGAYNVLDHEQETCQGPQFDNLLLEENQEDNNALLGLNREKSNTLWEWEELLLDENFNFQNLP